MKVLYPIKAYRVQCCHYYNKNAIGYNFEIAALTQIISYGVELKSIDDRHPDRVSLLWDSLNAYFSYNGLHINFRFLQNKYYYIDNKLFPYT